MDVAQCKIRPGFYALLMLVFFSRGESGPGGGGRARWTSDGGRDSQAPLQPPSTSCNGGYSGIPPVSHRAVGGVQWHSICFPSSSRVAAGLVLVGSFLDHRLFS